MICISPQELLHVGLWDCYARLSLTALGELLLQFHVALRSCASGWWGPGPAFKAELRLIVRETVLPRLWCIIGLVGCALGALKLLISLPDSFTSRAPFLLALVDYVVRLLVISGDISLNPAPTYTACLTLRLGRISALC